MKEIEYTTYSWIIHKIPDTEVNQWALKAINLIAENEWWEASQDHYFEIFFKDQITTIYEWFDWEKYILSEKGVMEEVKD